MKSIREKARELMKGSCRVCPECNGRVCAGEVPGMGGLGNGAAFRENVRALAAITLNMRLLHEVTEPSTAVRWLGIDLSMPVIAAPIGGIDFNAANAMPEADYDRAVLEGCRTAGIIGCTGDGAPPAIIQCGLDAIQDLGGHGIPVIKPWEGAELDEKMERALASGGPAMGMDIDAAGLITLRKMGRPVGPKSPREIAEITERVHKAGKRFILKGVMTIADARAAVEAGVDAIVVSNHGGRVLASAPGTAEVLPIIADAVRGRIGIMVDGGVRTGSDVFKMLALGADVVAVGRPVMIAAIGGGAEGVAKYLEAVRNELVQIMILTGTADAGAVDSGVLFGV